MRGLTSPALTGVRKEPISRDLLMMVVIAETKKLISFLNSEVGSGSRSRFWFVADLVNLYTFSTAVTG